LPKDNVISHDKVQEPLAPALPTPGAAECPPAALTACDDTAAVARVTPDLAAPSGPLVPLFPLQVAGTQVALFAGAPEELWIHWTLAADDAVSAGSGFPAAGGRPTPILRLRRLRGDGSFDLIEERQLRLPGIGGEGETVFRVGQDYSRFEADLGLGNLDGGWLLLARSNEFQHAAQLGLAFPLAAAVTRRKQDPELSCATVQPMVSGNFQRDDPQQGSPASAIGLPPIAVDVRPREETQWIAASSDLLAAADHDPTDADLCSEHATDAPPRIPVLGYGMAVCSGSDLLVEAELYVHGWAAPNTEIELFGLRYWVGAGGRFQFVLKVDDPALLKQAFALHPPPELICVRED
jgi:hypothetical protein